MAITPTAPHRASRQIGHRMSKPTTHVLMAVDKSGSMGRLAADVRGGFNSYVDSLTGDDYKYRLTVALFDHDYKLHCCQTKPKKVARLDAGNYAPGGTTALLDAIGRIIADFEKDTTLDEHDRVMLVVQTDGEENTSREYDLAGVRKLIEERQATGRWSCLFIGAGIDAWKQSEGMGFSCGSTITVAASSVGTQSSYAGLTKATRRYAGGASGDDAAKLIADATS